MIAFASGTGEGVITEDGCSADVYTLLPAGNEPDIIHDAVPPGASILELGAGAGRVTHPLLRLGHPVVAVDSSEDMLAHIRGAPTVADRIETLDLGERFDVVLLGSHLINVPDADMRTTFLRCCRRHVRVGGCVLIERHAPEWFDTATAVEHTADGITYRLRDITRPGRDLLDATVEYEVAGRVWTQSFRAERVDDRGLTADLHAAGLAVQDQLTDDGTWIRAAPHY